MPQFKHVLRNFSGGILEDKREQSPSHFSITKHFDTFTYPTKLVPYAQLIPSEGLSGGDVKDLNILRFLYAVHLDATHFRLYGLGANGSGNVKLYHFDIDAGTPNTTNWQAATNGESASGIRCTEVLFAYKGYLYTLSGGTNINRYDTTEANPFSDGWQNIEYTGDAAPPILCKSDDNAYFFGDNQVYRLNNTSWNGVVLQLPTDERIMCRAEYGNYLAIGTVSIGTLDVRSTVYLWDRDSSLTTLSDKIDFGAGTLMHLANLNNKLIGVLNGYIDNEYSLGKGKVIVKQANGSFAVPLAEIVTDEAAPALSRTDFVKDDKLYFPMSAPLNGDDRLGIWAVDQNGKIALDTVVPGATSIDGIYAVADLWWIAHSQNGSVSHTDATGAYSTTDPSILETLILSTINVTPRGTIIMNPAIEKKLLGVTAMHEPLPAGAKVTVKYRRDNETDWTEIFTNDEDDSTHYDATTIENAETEDGEALGNYNEIQFRVESYGGAVITGLMYGGETIDTQKY